MRTTDAARSPLLRITTLLSAALMCWAVGGGTASAAAGRQEPLAKVGLWAENSVTLPDGDVVVSVVSENRLKRIDAETHKVTTIASVKAPGGLVLRGDTLYVAAGADPANVLVRRASIESVDLRTGRHAVLLSGLPFVNGLAALPDGSLLFTATVDVSRAGVYRTSADLRGYRRINTSIPTPNGLTVGPDGQAYVGSTLRGDITRLDPDTGATTAVSGWMPLIDDLTYAPDGYLYAATNVGALLRVDPRTGGRTTVVSGLLTATSAKTYDATRVVVTRIDGQVALVAVR